MTSTPSLRLMGDRNRLPPTPIARARTVTNAARVRCVRSGRESLGPEVRPRASRKPRPPAVVGPFRTDSEGPRTGFRSGLAQVLVRLHVEPHGEERELRPE